MDSTFRSSVHPSRQVPRNIDGLRNYLRFIENMGITGVDCSEESLQRIRAWGTRPKAAPEDLGRIRCDLGDCKRCELNCKRNAIVFGAGNPGARLMFVGDAPGCDEDMQGEPFAGEAGQLLSSILQAAGLTRDAVYICYIVKCRPPENRTALPAEIAACLPFVQRQIAAIRPACICALGSVAAQTLLNSTEPITRLRGRFHNYEGIKLMPTFHPAYLLKNTARKREVWEDMKQIMRLLDIPVLPR